MTYTIPAKKLIGTQLTHYTPKVRTLACYSRYFDPKFGDWFRFWEDIYSQTKHAPDIPILTTLGLTDSNCSKLLTAAIRRCFPLVGASIEKVSSHSARKSGVAEALAIHAPPERIAVFGGWKSCASMFPYTTIQATASDYSYHFWGHLLPPIQHL